MHGIRHPLHLSLQKWSVDTLYVSSLGIYFGWPFNLPHVHWLCQHKDRLIAQDVIIILFSTNPGLPCTQPVSAWCAEIQAVLLFLPSF